MTAKTMTPEQESYLAAVRDELDDLPEEDRAGLLEDLAQHLDDIASDADLEVPLVSQLGAPAEYAAELRSAAGLPPRAIPAAGAGSPKGQRRSWDPSQWVVSMWEAKPLVEFRRFLPQLRPSWWVLRGLLVVAIPALWAPNSSDDFPFPTIAGSRVLGVIISLVAVVVSVLIGKRKLNLASRMLVYAGNLAVVLAAMSLVVTVEPRLGPKVMFAPAVMEPSYVLESRHGPVTNIYPYSADGVPLENVLLYDQDGRPLRSEKQLWWADRCDRVVSHPLAADGVAVEFAYPKNYVVGNVVPGMPCEQSIQRPQVPLPAFAPRPPAQ